MKKLLVILATLMVLAGCSSSKDDAAHQWQNELLSNNTIIVGVSPDYPPYESLSTKGDVEGFDIDMANEVLAIINAKYDTNYTITWKTLDFDLIVGSLQAKQIDLGISGFTYDPEREVIFTSPYITSKQVLVTRDDTAINSLADLDGKKVGVQLGTTGEKAINDMEDVNFASVTAISDYNIAFQQLQVGQYDVLVCDEAVADNYVNALGLVKVDESLVDEEMSIIINKANTQLADVIDAAVIEFVNSAAYGELRAKWGIAN